MVCIWANSVKLTWAVAALQKIIMNMHLWASRLLKPRIQTWLFQALNSRYKTRPKITEVNYNTKLLWEKASVSTKRPEYPRSSLSSPATMQREVPTPGPSKINGSTVTPASSAQNFTTVLSASAVSLPSTPERSVKQSESSPRPFWSPPSKRPTKALAASYMAGQSSSKAGFSASNSFNMHTVHRTPEHSVDHLNRKPQRGTSQIIADRTLISSHFQGRHRKSSHESPIRDGSKSKTVLEKFKHLNRNVNEDDRDDFETQDDSESANENGDNDTNDDPDEFSNEDDGEDEDSNTTNDSDECSNEGDGEDEDSNTNDDSDECSNEDDSEDEDSDTNDDSDDCSNNNESEDEDKDDEDENNYEHDYEEETEDDNGSESSCEITSESDTSISYTRQSRHVIIRHEREIAESGITISLFKSLDKFK